MPDTPTLTAAQRDALYDALHADIDGDLLVGADGYGEDIGMQHAGAGDVTRWAVNAVGPLVAGWLAEARAEACTRRHVEHAPPDDFDWEPFAKTPRLTACVMAWPECFSGEYDPRCCRFPKSCSCTSYDERYLKPGDLETDEATP